MSRRAENVCYEASNGMYSLITNLVLYNSEHLSKARFCNKPFVESWATGDFEEKQLLQMKAIFFIAELNGPK